MVGQQWEGGGVGGGSNDNGRTWKIRKKESPSVDNEEVKIYMVRNNSRQFSGTGNTGQTTFLGSWSRLGL